MIFDAHTHMPSEGWTGEPCWAATVAEAVNYLKGTGTDAALFNTWQGVFAETERDLEEANAAALDLAERYKDFLYPGAAIHPAYPAASRRWLARFRECGFPWVGELVAYHKPYRFTDTAFLDLAAECAEHGQVLQMHVNEDIVEVARRFPELPVVCAHIDAKLCERLAPLPNVWLEISGYMGGLAIGAIEAAYKAFGPDRLLYGSDFTGYDPRCYHVRLKAAVPALKERRRIFSRNLLRLLRKIEYRCAFV